MCAAKAQLQSLLKRSRKEAADALLSEDAQLWRHAVRACGSNGDWALASSLAKFRHRNTRGMSLSEAWTASLEAFSESCRVHAFRKMVSAREKQTGFPMDSRIASLLVCVAFRAETLTTALVELKSINKQGRFRLNAHAALAVLQCESNPKFRQRAIDALFQHGSQLSHLSDREVASLVWELSTEDASVRRSRLALSQLPSPANPSISLPHIDVDSIDPHLVTRAESRVLEMLSSHNRPVGLHTKIALATVFSLAAVKSPDFAAHASHYLSDTMSAAADSRRSFGISSESFMSSSVSLRNLSDREAASLVTASGLREPRAAVHTLAQLLAGGFSPSWLSVSGLCLAYRFNPTPGPAPQQAHDPSSPAGNEFASSRAISLSNVRSSFQSVPSVSESVHSVRELGSGGSQPCSSPDTSADIQEALRMDMLDEDLPELIVKKTLAADRLLRWHAACVSYDSDGGVSSDGGESLPQLTDA